MSAKAVVRVGGRHKSVNYGEFFIVDYIDCMSVLIKFTETGFELLTNSASIRSGQVKDYILPKIYGVGFVGIGDHSPTINGCRSPAYECWRGMLKRCYDKNRTKKNASYKGVSVCSEWHNFQNFAKWYTEIYPKDGGSYHIDKDLKQVNVENKVYSPETCLFLTPIENNILAQAKTYLLKDPLGKIIEVYNLAKFAKDNGLTRRSMGKVHDGSRSHHKGWTKA